MSHIQELETLLKKDVLIEVNDNIKELKEMLKNKKTKPIEEELHYMEEIKKYFDEVVADIENNSITQEQALDILEGLEEMRADNQEV
jgi:cellobiose phosphorylase